jgi:hypothetical protein
MRTVLAVALACVYFAAFGLLAACSGNHDVAKGTIRGRLLAVGGPAPGTARPLPGTVTLQNAVTHLKTIVHVNADGRYLTTVAVGRYAIEGRSPLYGSGKYRCKAFKDATASVAAPAVVDVFCQEV